jgi:hypothetical protein
MRASHVLVDTSVWSLVLRRSPRRSDEFATELKTLIEARRAFLIGPIRQELLSGVREPSQFTRLQNDLRAFPDLAIRSEDYEEAAAFFNRCRAQGVQGSNTDFLLCAVATRRSMEILTADRDFTSFEQVLPIRLHAIS